MLTNNAPIKKGAAHKFKKTRPWREKLRAGTEWTMAEIDGSVMTFRLLRYDYDLEEGLFS
jgi:hypothetical protein